MKAASWRVLEQKLGRQKAVATYDYEKHEIAVDPRQCSRDRLDSLIHEMTHALFPNLTEAEVISAARRMTRVLWNDGYRRIEK